MSLVASSRRARFTRNNAKNVVNHEIAGDHKAGQAGKMPLDLDEIPANAPVPEELWCDEAER